MAPTFAELVVVVSDGEQSAPSQVPQAAACAIPGTSPTASTNNQINQNQRFIWLFSIKIGKRKGQLYTFFQQSGSMVGR